MACCVKIYGPAAACVLCSCSLAFKRGRGERAIARLEPIWMVNLTARYRSSLACCDTGLQQHACFVAGSLAFKRGRGERVIARLEQSQIWMVNLDCAINYRSSLECCVKIYGPAAACVLCSWSACPQARPRRARRRESRPITNLDGRFRLRDRLPINLACLSRFAGPQQLVCFVAGLLAFKRGRGECAIARLEQSQICMVNLDCAINHRSSLASCVKIYGPAAACVLCS